MDTPQCFCCGKQVHILVVDDDEDNLLLIREQLLQILDCCIFSAKDGQEALSMLRQSQPDLILMDIMLPELDGIEVVRRLKQDPKMRSIPVIAVTAMARMQDEELALQVGCNDYVRKPYELEQLASAIEKSLKAPCCL